MFILCTKKNRFERGVKETIYIHCVEEKRWFMTPPISHLQCSLVISSQVLQPPTHTLPQVTSGGHMMEWGDVSQFFHP